MCVVLFFGTLVLSLLLKQGLTIELWLVWYSQWFSFASGVLELKISTTTSGLTLYIFMVYTVILDMCLQGGMAELN